MAASERTWPFGLAPGTTRDELRRLIGEGNIVDEKPSALVVKTVPKPHPIFESYTLVISPEHGLVKVFAVSLTLNTNRFGDQLKEKFSGLASALEKRYGEPKTAFDMVLPGSDLDEPEYWMLGLQSQERVLEHYWAFDPPPERLTNIALTANALDLDSGYLTLGYEYVGFKEVAEKLQDEQDAVL
jgi:hypothetical protein